MATPSLAGTKAGCCPLRPTTNVMTVTTMAAATTNGAERLIEWTSFHGQTGALLTDARYVTCPNRGCGCRARFGGARSARALAPPQALPGGALHACRGDGPAWRGPRAAASHCLAARGWRGARRRGGPRILAALGVVVLLHTFWDWRPLPLPWNFVWLVAVAGTSVVALRLVLRHANAASAVPCALRSAAKYPPNLRTLRNSAAKYRVFACAARGHTL